MNRDVKSGLALCCLAAFLGVLWLVLAGSDDPALRSGAGALGALAVVAVLCGLGVVIKGLVVD